MLAFLWERRRHGDTENGVHERHRDYSSKYSADMAQHDKPHLMRFAGVCTEAANPLNGIDDHCTCTVNVFFFSLIHCNLFRYSRFYQFMHISPNQKWTAMNSSSLFIKVWFPCAFVWVAIVVPVTVHMIQVFYRYIAHGALILNSGIWSYKKKCSQWTAKAVFFLLLSRKKHRTFII